MNDEQTRPMIAMRGVRKAFGANTVLDGLDLTVRANRKSVLIGAAASGKTVLMKCLSGIYAADAGTIEIDGKPMAKAGTRDHTDLMRSVGVLFQQGGLFDGLPVWRNVAFRLLQQRGTTAAEARRIAVETLAKVNLSADTADLYPAELSGGMQKRVGIARAMADDPSLLLLDEPTAGLDPITTAIINRLIDEVIRETGATVLSITSDMDSARTAYDDLYMLHGGRIIWGGPTASLATADDPHVRQMVEGRRDGPMRVVTDASV